MARVDLAASCWPVHAVEHAMRALASAARFPMRHDLAGGFAAPPDVDAGAWVTATATVLGLEATPVEVPYDELSKMLRRAAPALVAMPDAATVLAVLGTRGRNLRVYSFATRRVELVPIDVVCHALGRKLVAEATAALDRTLAGLPPRTAGPARRALVAERLRAVPFTGCWVLRPPPGASFWAQSASARIPTRAIAIVALHLCLVAMSILGWTILGQAALQGRLESGWMRAWGLLLLTFVPIYVWQAWLRGKLAVDFGRLLKRRLLWGAMHIDAEILRREGVGQLVGRALETNAIDALAPSVGLTAALAVIELMPTCAWLAFGSGGWAHALLLAGVIVTMLGLGVAAYRRTVEWTDTRRGLTQELVERMGGHRTRLAQRNPRRWHEGEDELLARYGTLAGGIDRFEVGMQIVPYAWLAAGLLMIAPGFVRGDAPLALAIGLGGTMMSFASLGQVAQGMRQVVEAAAGWRQIAPLFAAAARPSVAPAPAIAVLEPRRASAAGEVDRRPTLLSATGVTFRYPGRAAPVLDDVSLTIEHGDRILLEGPSGGGKTTLAAVLAGLQRPSSGLLLLDGFDHPTLGDAGWRARVAVAAQYHDNHIFADTFAFNALLGRPNWPETREDFDDLLAICHELGLDDLLGRMSGSVAQNVGEGGWRLSHGERSRVFIARALLQKAPLVVLDESFAALDPKTLESCLRCVLRRAETLVVIAHP